MSAAEKKTHARMVMSLSLDAATHALVNKGALEQLAKDMTSSFERFLKVTETGQGFVRVRIVNGHFENVKDFHLIINKSKCDAAQYNILSNSLDMNIVPILQGNVIGMAQGVKSIYLFEILA